jgi:hypothetical protein
MMLLTAVFFGRGSATEISTCSSSSAVIPALCIGTFVVTRQEMYTKAIVWLPKGITRIALFILVAVILCEAGPV